MPTAYNAGKLYRRGIRAGVWRGGEERNHAAMEGCGGGSGGRVALGIGGARGGPLLGGRRGAGRGGGRIRAAAERCRTPPGTGRPEAAARKGRETPEEERRGRFRGGA